MGRTPYTHFCTLRGPADLATTVDLVHQIVRVSLARTGDETRLVYLDLSKQKAYDLAAALQARAAEL